MDESFLYDDHLLEKVIDLFKLNMPFVSYLNQVIDYTLED